MMKYFFAMFLLPLTLLASQTQSLIISGYDALARGTFSGTMLLEGGFVALAPKTQVVAHDLPGSVLFMTELSPDTYWASSAGPASILELSKGKSKAVFQSDRPFFTSIIALKDGRIAATTGPSGGVYLFSSRADSKPQYFAVPTLDLITGAAAHKNDLYLVGGGKEGGQLLKMALPSGKVSVLAQIAEPLAKSIFIADSKAGPVVYFGGSEFGTIYRYNGKSNESIYSGPASEVTSIVVDKKQRIFASFIDADGQLAKAKADGSGLELAIQSWLRSDIQSSQVVLIEEHKAPRILWQANDTSVFSLYFDEASEELFAGTGDLGRTLKLKTSGLGRADVLFQAPENGEVVSLLKNERGQLLSLTANEGTITSIDLKAREPKGSYVTQVIDAASSARFGTILVNDGRLKADVSWRVGNTALPDETWGSFTTKPGFGRFAQAKIVLREKAEAITQIRLSYLPMNQKPVLKEARLLAPNVHLQLTNPTSETQRQITLDENAFKNSDSHFSYAPQSNGTFSATASIAANIRTVYAWAQDPDLDILRYRFELLKLDDHGKITVRQLLKDWSNDPFVSFDAAQAGEGRFQVVASVDDFINNGPGRMLQDSAVTQVFELTSVLPEFKNVAANIRNGKTELAFAIEAKVPLAAVQCSDPKGNWFMVNPEDGIIDDRKETFRFELNFVPEFRSITCQAMDIDQNARKIDIKVLGK